MQLLSIAMLQQPRARFLHQRPVELRPLVVLPSSSWRIVMVGNLSVFVQLLVAIPSKCEGLVYHPSPNFDQFCLERILVRFEPGFLVICCSLVQYSHVAIGVNVCGIGRSTPRQSS